MTAQVIVYLYVLLKQMNPKTKNQINPVPIASSGLIEAIESEQQENHNQEVLGEYEQDF